MIIIQIAGHLGTDPETRVSPSGLKVTNLRVATNVYQNGKDETVWWRVTLWGTEFDKVLSYLKKGSAIFVVGEMGKPEIYNDREGKPQVSLNITGRLIKLSPFGRSNSQEGSQGQGQSQGYAQGGGYAPPPAPKGEEGGGYQRYSGLGGSMPATTLDEVKSPQNYQSVYGGMSADEYSETEEKEEQIPF